MSVDNIYILQYWDKSVALDESAIMIKIYGDTFSFKKNEDAQQMDGWYAVYDKKIFVFFKDNSNNIFIGWDSLTVNVNQIDNATWGSSIKGRLLECFDKENKQLFKVDYHTYHRFFYNPVKLISEFLIPDDDWALVADLPSFVHSCIEDRNIFDKFNELQERL